MAYAQFDLSIFGIDDTWPTLQWGPIRRIVSLAIGGIYMSAMLLGEKWGGVSIHTCMLLCDFIEGVCIEPIYFNCLPNALLVRHIEPLTVDPMVTSEN